LTSWVVICYNNKMKNKTVKNLIILGTIIFSFSFANGAFASSYGTGYHSSSYHGDGADVGYSTSRYTSNSSDYLASQNSEPTVVNNYYYGSQTSKTSSATTSPATVAKSNIDSVSNTLNKENSSLDSNSSLSDNLLGASAANGLTALSLRGSGGFMPSSIWQWIFVAILILVIITLIRILAHGSKKVVASH